MGLLEELTLFFICIISASYFSIIINTNNNMAHSQQQQQATKHLAVSTWDTMENARAEEDTLCFDTAEKRANTITTLLEYMGLNLGDLYTSIPEKVSFHLPFIALIDDDGMYVAYKEEYQDNTYSKSRSNIVTPLSTWSHNFGSYNIRFYLSNKITITDLNTNQKHTGNYASLYEYLEEPTSLSFMDTPETFLEVKNDVIINDINNQLEYYMNCHNYQNRNDFTYSFSMPKVDRENWARMVDAPCIFTFFQGEQTLYKTSYLNTYAITGSELTEEPVYYVIEESLDAYYHTASCLDESQEYTYCGNMVSCAKRGAYPCPECVN